MCFPQASAVLVCCLSIVLCSAGPGSLVRRAAPREDESSLRVSLEKVLDGVAAHRLFTVEASVRPTFESFPKNSRGQIPSQEVFPAIVRNYFAKEHGWLIKGLEPPTLKPKTTEVHDAQILKDRAPLVAEALLKARQSDRGLTLSDVVATIAALEHLILDESIALLKGAYVLNGQSVTEPLNDDTLHEVLASYLLVFRHGIPRDLVDAEKHRKMKARAQKSPDWTDLAKFEQDAVLRSGHQGSFPFSAASQMVKDMAEHFGKWQNSECTQMKANLMDIDATGMGRAPYGTFHAEPNHTSYQFTESADYLRRIGALDEFEEGNPQVRIANYLLAPSNCIASSEFYSICCLSECESIMTEIEGRVLAPTLAPQELLDLVGTISSSSMEAPRQFSQALAEEMYAVAGHHGGDVPLHSAGFKRWLHLAFPNECSQPTASESAAEESENTVVDQWLELNQECTRLPKWHPAMEDVFSV